MPIRHPLLLLPVARQARSRTPHGPINPISNPRSKITQLPLSLLALALQVLISTFLLQGFAADEVPDGFFAGTDGLVPGALGTVGVVFGGCAGGADGKGAGFGSGLRGVVFGLGPGAGLVGFGLGTRGVS
jgi:hypothetical protein